jgi:hypothetical protein
MKALLIVGSVLVLGSSDIPAFSPSNPPSTRPPGTESQTSKTIRKLENIYIPVMNFSDAKLSLVCTFLTTASKDYDPQGDGIEFTYDTSGFDTEPILSIKFENDDGRPLIYLLELLTQRLPISYAIEDNRVTLKKANKTVVPLTHAVVAENSAYVSAKAKSDFIISCTVLDEGPIGTGPSASGKSYQVAYKPIFWSIVGLDLTEKIWIHYDSEEFPKELNSGKEDSYHKGDRFIAFIDYKSEKKDWSLRIVRLDPISKEAEIKKTVEPSGSPNPLPPLALGISDRRH